MDSSVAAALVHRAIGDRLTCIFVDHGLLRLHEREQVEHDVPPPSRHRARVVDASELFLERLAGIEDPEEKRRRIGHTFIDVFEEAAKAVGDDVRFLVQGTLYPDVIESLSPKGGPSVTIKTHHNVGGLPEQLKFALIEPLRELFKDEVRQVGRELGLPEEMVGRHPFPGPGPGHSDSGRCDSRRRSTCFARADHIYIEEIRAAGLYDEIWQAFAVLLPVRSGCDGRLANLRPCRRASGRDEPRWDDGGLVSVSARRAWPASRTASSTKSTASIASSTT